MPVASGRPESSTSKILMIFALVVVAVLAWFIAPMFLPIWRWQNIDFAKLASEHQIAQPLLMQEYDIVFRYHPRGNSELDPVPFQIVTMNPPWASLDPENREFEENVLVRASIISDKDGGSVSKLFLGNTHKDRYFSAKAWRFPPGAFGKPATRPVIVYKALSLEKLDMGAIDHLDREIRLGTQWENDDEWEGRYDEFDPSVLPEAEAPEGEAPAAE